MSELPKKTDEKGKIIPRVIRLHNPGALRDKTCRYYYDPQTANIKLVQSILDESRYNYYNTQEEGVIAQALTLQRYYENGRNTVSSILSRYASQKAGNNTPKYVTDLKNEINRLLKKQGKTLITEHTKLDLTNKEALFNVASSMTKLEGGQKAYSSEVFRSGIAKALAMRKAEQEAQAGKNPFYMDKPTQMDVFNSSFIKKYMAYQKLKSEVICQLPNGQNLTLLDIGKAIQDKKISFEQGVLLRYIAQNTNDKSLESIQKSIQTEAEKLNATNKNLPQALQSAISNAEPHTSQTLQTCATSYIEPSNETNGVIQQKQAESSQEK